MTREPAPKLRKLSSKLETITVSLSTEEIDTARRTVCDLRDKQDALKNQLATVVTEFKAKAKELEQAEGVARRAISTGKQDVEVMVEEYLSDGHDGVTVVKIRADTGGVVGQSRRPTAAEAQEALPMSDGGFGS